MPVSRAASQSSCIHPSLRSSSPASASGSVSLPVLADHGGRGTIRHSRAGKRRAIILGVVQGLLILHIVLWATGVFGPSTITPIEPSESMEFSKHGIVNAGLIFFALALLSTLILGRWFCGWGCHVVLLQDLCGWMMKKLGVRPKPFRSRLLLWIPLLLALYMFIWPLAHRFGLIPLNAWMGEELGEGHWLVSGSRTMFDFFDVQLPVHAVEPWNVSVHMTTKSFWQTFPGVMVAAPFLLICGFATVYFLGSKGFCTYGCPYGGFFAPLDKLAVGKIRVTDACHQCGHCTAVCTSNVRVHEEVRDFGMVVDPGCMKCMDCVSVCPNDALYFGLGAPTILAKPRVEAPAPRKHNLTWPQEIALLIVFGLAFFAVRGPLYTLPLLFAAGTAGVTTYLVWKCWQILSQPSVNLHQFRLRYKGRVNPSGVVMLLATLLVAALTIHTGAVNTTLRLASNLDDQVLMPWQQVYSPQGQPLEPDMAAAARKALRHYARISSVRYGGWSFWPMRLSPSQQHNLDMRQAWLASTLRDFSAAKGFLQRAMNRELGWGQADDDAAGRIQSLAIGLTQVSRATQPLQATKARFESLIAEHPHFEQLADEYAQWLAEFESSQAALEAAEAALSRNPGSLLLTQRLSLLELQAGHVERAIELIQKTLIMKPVNPDGYYFLAMAHAMAGDNPSAERALREADRQAPENFNIKRALCQLLLEMDRKTDAEPFCRKAQELAAQMPQPPTTQ